MPARSHRRRQHRRLAALLVGCALLAAVGGISFDASNKTPNKAGSDGADRLIGHDGPNELRGNGGNDYVHGKGGNDALFGNSGNDEIYGGDGNDQISGGPDDDSLAGNDGNDSIDGGPGNDQINGGPGNNTLAGGDGNNVIAGGAGNDVASGGWGQTQYRLGGGSNTIWGGNGPETFTSQGLDTFVGAGGNDAFIGTYDTASGSQFFGGDGDDFFDMREVGGNVHVDCGNGTDGAVISDYVTVSNCENVINVDAVPEEPEEFEEYYAEVDPEDDPIGEDEPYDEGEEFDDFDDWDDWDADDLNDDLGDYLDEDEDDSDFDDEAPKPVKKQFKGTIFAKGSTYFTCYTKGGPRTNKVTLRDHGATWKCAKKVKGKYRPTVRSGKRTRYQCYTVKKYGGRYRVKAGRTTWYCRI